MELEAVYKSNPMDGITQEIKEEAIINVLIENGIFGMDSRTVCDLIMSGEIPYIALLPIKLEVEQTEDQVIIRY